MSELQAGEAESVVNDDPTPTEQPVENAEQATQVSEPATDSGEVREEKITFSEGQQKVLDDMAAKKTFKIREAERKADGLQRQLDEMSKKLPEEARPDVPELPDQYADDFQSKLKARDQALMDAAAFDARASDRQLQQLDQEQKQQAEQQKALNEKTKVYSENAAKKGVKLQELQVAGQAVYDYGLRDDVTVAILDDVDGALVTLFLSKNPQAIDSLNNANVLTIGEVYSDIRSKAAGLAVKKSTTPDPIETLKGAGVTNKDPELEGMTFE